MTIEVGQREIRCNQALERTPAILTVTGDGDDASIEIDDASPTKGVGQATEIDPRPHLERCRVTDGDAHRSLAQPFWLANPSRRSFEVTSVDEQAVAHHLAFDGDRLIGDDRDPAHRSPSCACCAAIHAVTIGTNPAGL